LHQVFQGRKALQSPIDLSKHEHPLTPMR
jgi:hypothetical protein